VNARASTMAKIMTSRLANEKLTAFFPLVQIFAIME